MARTLSPTEVSAGTARGLLVVFVLLLLIAPLWDQLAGDVPWRVWRTFGEQPRIATLSTAMERFEDDLVAASPAARWARRPAQWSRSHLEGGNSQVAVGRQGWLFLRPGTLSLLQPTADDSPQRATVAFAKLLARQGIDLVVVPAPSKAALVPQRLAPRLAAPQQPLMGPAERVWRSALWEAGVELYDPAPDLLQRLGEGAFLKSDSHWSPAAVELVAARLAERLAPRLSSAEAAATWTRRPVEVVGRGDLRDSLGGEPGAEERVMVQQVTAPQGELWGPQPGAPVLLLGDSFSNVFSDERLGWGRGAGLAEQLAFRLQVAVDRLAIDAGGANGARQRLRARSAAGDDVLTATRVVVWQVAGREIAAGGWEVMASLEGPETVVEP
ncbi:MAG: hypothetical protein AAF604_00075 [Acidobacteriota bacterium]